MREPLYTRISKVHQAKIEELRGAGFALYAIIEQGIDAVYEKMFHAQIIDGSAQQEIEQAEQAA